MDPLAFLVDEFLRVVVLTALIVGSATVTAFTIVFVGYLAYVGLGTSLGRQ